MQIQVLNPDRARREIAKQISEPIDLDDTQAVRVWWSAWWRFMVYPLGPLGSACILGLGVLVTWLVLPILFTDPTNPPPLWVVMTPIVLSLVAAYLHMWLATGRAYRLAVRRALAEHGFEVCTRCGYVMTGLERCPECGAL